MANMKKAEQVYNKLTTLKLKNGGERVIWKENTPDELREEFQNLTGAYDDHNFAELDEYYNVLQMLVSYMSGYDDFTIDELYQCDWRDDSNYDRAIWLAEVPSRGALYEEIKDNGARGIFELIGDMQDFSRHSFAEYIFTKMFDGGEE